MPRRSLNRDRILDAAIELADREGFAAVTLRRLASELGVHVTSLYNHVPTYDAVIDGMLETLLLEAKLPTKATTWQQWVESFMNAFATLARTHPGGFGAFERGPVQGPAAARTFEVGLDAFARAGLDTADAYNALKTVMLTSVGIGVEQAGLAGEKGELTTDVTPLSAEEFPRTRALAAVADDADVVGFVIEATVAGLATLIRRRKRTR